MANVIQPNAPQGSFTPLTTSVCPLDSLVGRSTGSGQLRFKCDNGHQYDDGAATAITPTVATLAAVANKPSISRESNAEKFFDPDTGKKHTP